MGDTPSLRGHVGVLDGRKRARWRTIEQRWREEEARWTEEDGGRRRQGVSGSVRLRFKGGTKGDWMGEEKIGVAYKLT